MNWRKISEELPKKEGKILVKIENNFFVFSCFHDSVTVFLLDKQNYLLDSKEWRPVHFKKPTHWMYIDEPST